MILSVAGIECAWCLFLSDAGPCCQGPMIGLSGRTGRCDAAGLQPRAWARGEGHRRCGASQVVSMSRSHGMRSWPLAAMTAVREGGWNRHRRRPAEPQASRPDERRVSLDDRVPRLVLAVAGESHQVRDRQIAADLVHADLCRRAATPYRAHAHPPGRYLRSSPSSPRIVLLSLAS